MQGRGRSPHSPGAAGQNGGGATRQLRLCFRPGAACGQQLARGWPRSRTLARLCPSHGPPRPPKPRGGGRPRRATAPRRSCRRGRLREGAAMSEQALEELSALAAIYCEPGACEVLATSGEGGCCSARPGSRALPTRPGAVPLPQAQRPLPRGFRAPPSALVRCWPPATTGGAAGPLLARGRAAARAARAAVLAGFTAACGWLVLRVCHRVESEQICSAPGCCRPGAQWHGLSRGPPPRIPGRGPGQPELGFGRPT